MSKYPLLGMTLVELQSLTKRLGMPGFAAKQIASWLYEKVYDLAGGQVSRIPLFAGHTELTVHLATHL